MLASIMRFQAFIDEKIIYFNKLVTDHPERVKLIDIMDNDIEEMKAILQDMYKSLRLHVTNPRPGVTYTQFQIDTAKKLSLETGRPIEPWQIY